MDLEFPLTFGKIALGISSCMLKGRRGCQYVAICVLVLLPPLISWVLFSMLADALPWVCQGRTPSSLPPHLSSAAANWEMHKRCLSAYFLGTADRSAVVQEIVLLLQVLGRGERWAGGSWWMLWYCFLGNWVEFLLVFFDIHFFCYREEQLKGFLPSHVCYEAIGFSGFLPSTTRWEFLNQLCRSIWQKTVDWFF